MKQSGAREVAARVVRRVSQRVGVDDLNFPLLPGDVADSRRNTWGGAATRTPDARNPLRIAWVTTPPGVGSGGHTTMFRMVAAAEKAGHSCTLLLYDRWRGDLARQEAVIRRGWPSVPARVDSIDAVASGFDVCIATSWPTAHVLATRGAAGARCLYFVQDYEPFFYGRGSEYALAEDTYRFGFTMISMGNMVAAALREHVGVDSEVLQFGCDTDVYRLSNASGLRNGVLFYSKPGAARRGFELGVLALRELHARRPDLVIHAVGSAASSLPFPVRHHGVLAPQELSSLYNSCFAGLALSFTNISLLAEELLACGAVAVVNDSSYARSDLPHGRVEWAAPTPSGLADALVALAENRPDPCSVAASARRDWRPAEAHFVKILERVALEGPVSA